MRTDLSYGRLPDEREDHFLGLEAAHVVGTEALLTTRCQWQKGQWLAVAAGLTVSNWADE